MKTMENAPSTHPLLQAAMWIYGIICFAFSWESIDFFMKLFSFSLGSVSVAIVIFINIPKIPQAWIDIKKMFSK